MPVLEVTDVLAAVDLGILAEEVVEFRIHVAEAESFVEFLAVDAEVYQFGDLVGGGDAEEDALGEFVPDVGAAGRVVHKGDVVVGADRDDVLNDETGWSFAENGRVAAFDAVFGVVGFLQHGQIDAVENLGIGGVGVQHKNNSFYKI